MKNINIETIYLDFPIHKGKQILHVRTDHKRLQQVLLNLLSNALKFTEKNGRILVMVMLMRGKKESLRISVVDSGVGIKTEDQDKLFKLFGSIKNEQKKINVKGIGLGLAISKLIVGKFNGFIDFVSEHEQGSTFFYTFQLEDFDRQQFMMV